MKLKYFFILSVLVGFSVACRSGRKVYEHSDAPLTQRVQPKPVDSVFIPAPLKKGDTVIIIAPAGYVDATKNYIARADSLLLAWGLIPVHGKHLFEKHYTFAGTDRQRLSDLQWAFDHPHAKAIWMARGGYGMIRIMNDLDYSGLRKHPKWVVGFSDITFLLNQMYANGIASLHGLMPISLTHPKPERKSALVTLKNMLFGRKLKFVIDGHPANVPGDGEGMVVGGNLSCLVAMLGSSNQLNTDGKILFLEDVGEYPYAYDRMLFALANAGYFDNLQGLIIGDMNTKKPSQDFGETIEEMVLKHVKDKGYPVIFGFPAGHVVKNYTVPIGLRIKISVSKEKAKIQYE